MEVYLAVYDLSQGMARNLSVQFLGPNHAMDMIPHTALLVFGKEYFFGGGIQSVDPHYFRSMTGRRPVQTERLGTTRVSQEDFDAWCRQTAAQKYNSGTYDLLHRNCNHFSHDAALLGLRLAQGVPSWILQVPQNFLSSPMGQLLRPMLDQMQISQMPPVQVPPSSLTTATTATIPLLQASTGAATGTTADSQNPWASMRKTTNESLPTEAALSGSITPTEGKPSHPPTALSPTCSEGSSSINSSSILQKYTKPMLSNDTSSLTICASKLTPHLTEEAQHALDALSKVILLQEQNHDSSAQQDLVDDVVPQIWKLIQEEKAVSFSLLYLRIVALHFSQSKAVATCMSEIMWTLSNGEQNRTNDNGNSNCSPSQLFSTPASKSLAWCVVSNYTGSTRPQKNIKAPPDSLIPSSLVDAAIRDWNHDAVQVRQAACTFLYNYVICNGSKLETDEETVVSLVCSSLESLLEESDPTTRLRRLVVGARVVFGVHHSCNNNATRTSPTTTHCKEGIGAPPPPCPLSQTSKGPGYNEMAKDLIQDLGFTSLLQELATADYYESPPSKNQHPDSVECRQLALELIQKFQSFQL